MATNSFDTTPNLFQTMHFSEIQPPPPFLDERYTRLVEILNNSLPSTSFVLVGYWPTYNAHHLNAEAVNLMCESKQKLDIDLFLPISKTDSATWQRIHNEANNDCPDRLRHLSPVGGDENIVFYGGSIYISPLLGELPEDSVKAIVSFAFKKQLPPEHCYQKTGRTGDVITVIGDGASNWGQDRRAQDPTDAKPYLEIIPIISDKFGSDYLDSILESVGYSKDLKPVRCSAYQGQYSPLDLHVNQQEYVSWGYSGLPELNQEFVSISPVNALNWIRREVKAIALYTQLTGPPDQLADFISKQLIVLHQHIDAINLMVPGIYSRTELVDKINSSFVPIAQVLNHRFRIEVDSKILSQPQNS